MEIIREDTPLESLHPDFHISVGGKWLWNKNPSLHEGGVDRKVMFQFGADDADKLKDCPSVAKIGINQNPETSIHYPYIGFIYGNAENVSDLMNFGRQFRESQIIEGLTDTWVSKENAKITKL